MTSGLCQRCTQSKKDAEKVYKCTNCQKKLPLPAFNTTMVKNIGNRNLDRLLCNACVPSDNRVCVQCHESKPKDAFDKYGAREFLKEKCRTCLDENARRSKKQDNMCVRCGEEQRWKDAKGHEAKCCAACDFPTCACCGSKAQNPRYKGMNERSLRKSFGEPWYSRNHQNLTR